MKKHDLGTRPVKSEKGFTLIEILVAIMLLVVALLGMASVTTMVIKGNFLSKMMTTATTLAKDKMEDLKNISYTALPAAGTVTDYATAGGTVQASAAGSYYSRSRTLWLDSPATGMKRIEVKVEWPQQSPTHNITLKTFVAAGN